jgi:dihydroxyacetone kinase
VIVKNYTGDVLNFGLAIEMANVQGANARMLIFGEDVSIKGIDNSLVGKRGLAGVVLVHKIAGALAEEGASLDEVYEVGKAVADNASTMGVSLDKCAVPGREAEDSGIASDEIDIGMGIHNEPGVKRTKLTTLEETVSSLLQTLAENQSKENASGTEYAVMVNNLGALSVLELNVIADTVVSTLQSAHNIQPKVLLVGTYLTSLNGPGFSITLLRLTGRMEELLRKSTTATAWTPAGKSPSPATVSTKTLSAPSVPENLSKFPVSQSLLGKVISEIGTRVKADEPLITKLDTEAGDGDCGETLLAGATALQAAFDKSEISKEDLVQALQQISVLVGDAMGGTSGAIYGIFLNSLVASLNEALVHESVTRDAKILGTSGQSALRKLETYTKARKGHRTLMDALIPFVETFAASEKSDPVAALKEAVQAAIQGTKDTSKMKPSLGRATYVRADIFAEGKGFPDPGAVGLCSILRGILKAVDGTEIEVDWV